MDCEIGPEESVSTAVVRAVCAVNGLDPLSLRPLTEVVDPDALNLLFDARGDDTPRAGGSISFVYSNCRVTVENGEYLTIQLLESAPRLTRDANASKESD